MRIAPYLLVALSTIAAAKDLVIRERTTIEGADAKSFEVTQYYGDRKLVTDGPRQRTIIDLDAKTMTMVDKKAKAYTITTFDGIRQQGEAMRAKFETLPPEAQKQQVRSEVEITTKPSGKEEKIAGYAAKEYLVEAGPIHGSIWVTEAVPAPAGKGDFDKLVPTMRGVTRLSDRFNDAVSGLKGIALRKVVTRPGKDEGSSKREITEAQTVSQEAPPSEMLGVPEGFMKWTLPGLGG